MPKPLQQWKVLPHGKLTRIEDNILTVTGDNLGVFARQVAVLDGDGTIRRAADGDRRSLQLLPEGREQGRVDRDVGARD